MYRVSAGCRKQVPKHHLQIGVLFFLGGNHQIEMVHVHGNPVQQRHVRFHVQFHPWVDNWVPKPVAFTLWCSLPWHTRSFVLKGRGEAVFFICLKMQVGLHSSHYLYCHSVFGLSVETWVLNSGSRHVANLKWICFNAIIAFNNLSPCPIPPANGLLRAGHW